MDFDEARPIFRDGVDSYIYGIGVCQAEGNLHLLKSLHATSSCLLPTYALEIGIVPNGDVEAFG